VVLKLTGVSLGSPGIDAEEPQQVRKRPVPLPEVRAISRPAWVSVAPA